MILSVWIFTCLLAFTVVELPVNAHENLFGTLGMQDYVAESEPVEKRFFVKTRGKKLKVKKDTRKAGGEVLHEFDDLDIAVIKFGNVSDASQFEALGYNDLEEDLPRFAIGVRGFVRENKESTDLDEDTGTVRTLQSGQTIPTGVKMIFQNSLPPSSYYPSKSVSIPICIIDSGFYNSHPDLKDVYATAADSSQKNNINDNGCSHGTHVGGTVVAENNSIGSFGIFPGASLKIVKVFSGSNCGWTYSSDLISAANACANSGAKIISMSLGGSGHSSSEESAFYSIRQKGVLIIGAAGNSGNSQFSYPASYSSVMSVTAVDQNYNRASFSQYNSMVDIAAPGVNVYSTISTGGYAYYSGTSMAAPHVSGAAFLLWNKFPRCSRSQIENALLSTAMDLGSSGKDMYFGYGFIQYWSAADYLAAQCP